MMSLLSLKALALFCLLVGLGRTQDTVNPFENYKCNDTDQSNIEIGKNVTLCIHFKEVQRRMAFRIKVDEYSVISIGGGFHLANTINKKTDAGGAQKYPKGVSFLAQVAKNATYFPSLYLKGSPADTLIPLFNIVIKVNEGVIYDIVWDNACFSCETTNMCFSESVPTMNTSLPAVEYKNCKSESICADTEEESFKCDPKFYITWFGTDLNKRQLKSSNLAMSKFRQYSIGSLYNSAKDVFNSTLGEIKKAWKEVEDAANDLNK